MKKSLKIVSIVLVVVLTLALLATFVACNKKSNDSSKADLRFAAPEGTPALAMLTFAVDKSQIDGHNVTYAAVAPANIAAEMSSKSADIVIMPVNAGANLIRQGADYKLVSVAVGGSLFMVAGSNEGDALQVADVKGKKVACIGKTGVPGLVFRYVMKANGIAMIESGDPNENQVFVQYVADGVAARTLLVDGQVDFIVVGEPAATATKSSLGKTRELDMQAAYAAANANNGDTYPQAGLFVRTSLANDGTFMADLFGKLEANKTWVSAHASEVTAKAKQLYESAAFPAPAIARCAIDGSRLNIAKQSEIIAFLKNVMPKDAQGNDIDWDSAKDRIFG